MNFRFTKMFGDQEIVFQDTAASQQDFFRKVAFYMELPSSGPGGEKDLRIVFRTTREGHQYFSLISDSAGKEFSMGQYNDDSGRLFPKEWKDVYKPGSAPSGGKTPQPATTKPPVAATGGPPTEATTTTAEDVMAEYL